MKSVVIAAGLLLALGGAWGIAQESKEGRSGTGGMMQHMMNQPKSDEGSAQKPMGEMMQDCQEHHESAMKSIDQMTKIMDGARQSDDPEKMRAALDQSQRQLGKMKEHMAMCGKMMSMMEKMQGMGGMMRGGSK
jgi:phytoene dehydrogenase-like protein